MRLSPRAAALVVALLIAAYALPGLVGHDPWKPDEPYTFGIVLDMARTHDAIVPTVGGAPFVEKPPLYYWAAWASASLLSPTLPMHDAARVASLFFVLASLAAVAAASSLLWGEGVAGPAALLFLGTAGLESHAQRMQVDLALMLGFAIAMLGFAGCARARRWGGAVLGLGVGAGFLAKGVFAPAVLGVAALLLPLFFASWRSRAYFVQLAIALAVALPALVLWPLALYLRSPALFDEWFWTNNFGRFAGFAVPHLGASSEHGDWSGDLAWFLFPTWLFALGAAVREGRFASHHPALQVGLTLALVGALVLAASASMRAVYLLPLIPALVVAGVGALQAREGRYVKALAFCAVVIAGVLAIFMWATWLLLVVVGDLGAWEPLASVLPVPFTMPVRPFAVGVALALSVGFIVLAAVRRRLPAASLTLWVASLALTWGLANTLWLPWLDAAKSYRPVFEEVARRMPPDARCVVMHGLGESERAMVEYYLGVVSRARHDHEEDCRALMWEGNLHKNRGWPWPGQWKLAWRGHRIGETEEGFELFLRPESPLAGEDFSDPRRTGGR
jgi:4-amino-4-deoxy-L-arabinose transferase-like glycosyltransferase